MSDFDFSPAVAKLLGDEPEPSDGRGTPAPVSPTVGSSRGGSVPLAATAAPREEQATPPASAPPVVRERPRAQRSADPSASPRPATAGRRSEGQAELARPAPTLYVPKSLRRIYEARAAIGRAAAGAIDLMLGGGR